MGMTEQTESLLRQLVHTLEAFKQDTGKEPTLAVVSAEIFAKIMPALENIKHDKSYSEGNLPCRGCINTGLFWAQHWALQDFTRVAPAPEERVRGSNSPWSLH